MSGERSGQRSWTWRRSEDVELCRATYVITRGEPKRDGGDPGKGQEGIRCIVHPQRLHSAKQIRKKGKYLQKQEVETETVSTREHQGGLEVTRNTYILASQLPLEYCENSDTAWFGDLT